MSVELNFHAIIKKDCSLCCILTYFDEDSILCQHARFSKSRGISTPAKSCPLYVIKKLVDENIALKEAKNEG